VTRSGSPLPNGNITFMSPKLRRSAEVSSDGRYEVDGLAAGAYDVAIYSRGGTVYSAKYTVSGNSTYDIQIQGSALRGRVIDAANGAPIADATVWSQGSRERPVPYQATTDSDGRFILDAVTEGPLELHASTRQAYAPATQTITVASGSAQEVEFKLDRAQATLFRVVDAQSGATMDAFVSISDGSKQIGNGGPTREEDGTIRVYIGPGQYKAYVSARGFVQQSIDFTTPGPEVRVTLSQAGRVMVTAAKQIRFRLVAPGAPRPFYGISNGAMMENVPPGSYTLEVLGDDGKTVVKSMPVSVSAGTTTNVSVDL
jgi:hypothetical protein